MPEENDKLEQNEAPATEQRERTRQAGLTRRSFLSGLGAAGVAVAAPPALSAAQNVANAVQEGAPSTTAASGTVALALKVNGKERQLNIEPRVALLDALREDLDLPGTKKGCDHGQCGACTVHVNGRRVLSCMSFAVMHQGDEITTIEGLGQPGNLHPMQASFVEHDAFQCGYCTSGQIMSAVALLKEPVGPSDADVKNNMYGNICRCGAYPNIVAAVQAVRRQHA